MLCDKCLGKGCRRKKCDKGYIFYQKLPKVSYEAVKLFKAYIWLKNYNIMPDDGGWLDQSSFFVWMVEYCDLIHASWRGKIGEQNEINKKWVEQRKKNAGSYGG